MFTPNFHGKTRGNIGTCEDGEKRIYFLIKREKKNKKRVRNSSFLVVRAIFFRIVQYYPVPYEKNEEVVQRIYNKSESSLDQLKNS